MNEDVQLTDTQEISIMHALLELEPHSVHALVEVLKRLAHIIDSQYHESYRQAYHDDESQCAQDQLALQLFDDSDIDFEDAEHVPF